MAVGNRTETIANVDSKIVPAVANTTHRDLLNNDILASVVFRKDIIGTETPGGGTVSVSYTSKDTATFTIIANVVVSFTGMQNGDVKYISITKGAGNTISFSGSTDVSARKDYINSIAATVNYRVSNKNGLISVESINVDNEIVVDILEAYVSIGAWNMWQSGGGDIGKFVTWVLPSGHRILHQSAVIYSDGNTTDSESLEVASSTGVVAGRIVEYSNSNTRFELRGVASGIFDGSLYSSEAATRGYIFIRYRDFS